MLTTPIAAPPIPQPRQGPRMADGDVPPPDVNIPTISVKDGWSDQPPLIVGNVPPPPPGPQLPENGPHNDPPPAHSTFQVVLGSAREVEGSLLAKLRAAAGSYESLRAYVQSVAPWVFYAQTEVDAHYGRAKPTKDSQDAVAFLDNAMLGGADSLDVAGLFISQMDQSLQTYAHADKETLFPPA